MNEFPSTLRGDTLWYLRNYRRANLAVSWLFDETSQTLDATAFRLRLCPEIGEAYVTIDRAIHPIEY